MAPRQKTYSDEQKAQALALVASGTPVQSVARELKIGRATLRHWVDQNNGGLLAATQKTLATYNLDAMAVDLVDGSVRSVRNIQRATEDEAWVKRQSADQLAILYGVISDKLYRLLAAVRTEGPRDDGAANIVS